MLHAGLIVIAVALTCTMFATKQIMLGFACALFWFMVGVQSYQLATVHNWTDVYYVLYFATSFGMTVFTALAAYGLRERRDTLADKEMEKGDGKLIDEGGNGQKKKSKNWYEDDGIPDDDIEKLSPIKRRENRLGRAKRRENLR